jgi:mannose-6-phosphate isomerase-like protein (cupin superfamily)
MELDVAHSVVLGPGEGEVISDRAERTVRIKAGLDAIAVTETRYEPGERGPDAHIHRGHTDAFYVLEGTLDFELGPEREIVRLSGGSFVAAPPNFVHSFRNDGTGSARFLNFHAPSGGFADYLRAMRDGEDGSWFDQVDPPADGGRPFSDGTILRPGEGERIAIGASSVLLKASGASSDGQFFLSETSVEPGFPGPPPHVHRELHDLFFVLEGTLTLLDGDETVAASPGTFACFPPGAVHTFSNPGGEPVRILNFNTPTPSGEYVGGPTGHFRRTVEQSSPVLTVGAASGALAGWENYMRELGAAFADGGTPTPDEIGRIGSRYDFHVVSS